MGKGETTRQTILDRATELASQLGLTGLTIGALAESLDMSKSGLFAHFQSKEALQIQVLDHAAASFVAQVVEPALAAHRGVPRLQAIFDRWLDWDGGLPGGCVFVAASGELDDREGPVRDHLVELQRQWMSFLATSLRRAIDEGHIAPGVDPDQFAQDFYGIMLSWHFQARLLRDPHAAARARRAFDALIDAARTAAMRRPLPAGHR